MAAETADLTTQVLDHVAHGIAVLTLMDDAGIPRGMTVSSLTGASAEPPSVLVCIRTRASMHPHLTPGRKVALSLLAPGQEAVSNGFAFGVEDPFAVFPTHRVDGVPVVDGSAGYLVGSVSRVIDNHDTSVVIVSVSDAGLTGDAALVYWNRGYYRGLVAAGG